METTIDRASLAVRRQNAEAKLAVAHVLRGRQIIAGEPVTDGDIASLETEIASIIDAEAALTAQERQRAAENERERKERLWAQVEAAHVLRFAALEQAETSFRDAASSVRGVIDKSNEIRAAYRDLGEQPPPALDAFEEARRFSNRLSMVLRNVLHPTRFGDFQLSFGPFPSDTGWGEAERKLLNIERNADGPTGNKAE